MDYELLSKWSEIVGGFAFVAVAVWLFRTFVLPAVHANQTARNAELVQTERHRDDLQAALDVARASVAAARRDATEIVARGDAEAQRAHDRILEEARREAARLVTNAGGELDRARFAARDDLRIEFIEKALLRARTLAASQVTESVNARLVSRTVGELSSGKAG